MYINMRRHWEWDEGPEKRFGIQTFGGNLLWYMDLSPNYAGGAAQEQSFRDFMTSGAAVSVPAEIEREIREWLSMALLNGDWTMDDGDTL